MGSMLSYTPPRLYTGNEWYVGWNSFDPVLQKMRRKKIKLNHIHSVMERRKYAKDLISRIYEKLRKGWNPWIASEKSKSYSTFDDVVNHYDRLYIIDFLEFVYVDRNNSAQTRDNYLGWVKSFADFLIQHGYVKDNPAEGIKPFSKWSKRKEREYIPEDILIKVRKKIEESNKYFMLASYVLFYCFIRPKEMSRLKIRDINVKNRTIIIKANQSKNRRTAAITLPVKVLHLMIELNIFDHSGDSYLFSKKMQPGAEYASEKQFRDYWTKYVRKPLKLHTKYKFYSLKDTGVTMMLRANTDILSVRDQARHSSILITDTYTPHDIAKANPLIDKFECDF